MTDDETTTEQLAEIEGQATEYTPPEGWRVVQFGEPLRGGDEYDSGLNRYIRSIEPQPQPELEAEPQPQPEPQPEPQPIQVREGRWRTRGGEEKNIRSCEPLKGAYYVWPWTDGFMTFQDNGRHQGSQESAHDLVEYLGPIEENPQPQPEHSGFEGKILCEQTQPKQVNDWPSVRQLQDELKTLQTQLGESRQRVTQLEELVGSLRTINEAQEKTVRAAGQENTDLQHRLDVVSFEWAQQVQACKQTQEQLEAVKGELVTQAETSRRLRIELDAAQQVPQAVSDRFEEGWDAGTARAVETIAEWTEPFRRCGSERLAWMVMQNLPHIMRTLTGLAQED